MICQAICIYHPRRQIYIRQDLGLKSQTPFKSQSFGCFCCGLVKQSQFLRLVLALETNKTISVLIKVRTKANGAFQHHHFSHEVGKFGSKKFGLKKFCQ